MSSGAEYRVEVHGSVGGNLVVGDHNLIVNAAVGSSVSVVQEALRPKPVRRSGVRVLPRRPEAVLGRSSELGTITAAVVGLSTIQVYGPAGIGKSTLLRQAAYDIADEADGIVFLSATGRSALDVPQEIFEACYETSGYRPSQTELNRLMRGVRVCVVADDLVCAPDELTAVLDCAPDATFVLAAPERELWGSGQVLALAGLPEEAALALVRREFGRDLSAAEVANVVAEWRSTGGSPMSLLRAAATLRLAGPAALSPLVAPTSAPADSPSAGTVGPAVGRAAIPAPRTEPPAAPRTQPARGVASVTARLDPLLDALPMAERDVYALLGYIAPASATVPVIGALAHAPNLTHVGSAAERLVQYGLADRVGDAYRLADDLAVPPPDRTYRRDIGALVGALSAWLSRPDVRATEASDHGDLIVALIEAAVHQGDGAAACRLARIAAPLAALSLRWSVWRDVLTSGQAAAKAADDQEAYAYFTHERGIRLLCLGQAAAAAAVLATAAGLWHALGLGQSAAAAAHAGALASGGSAAASGAAASGGASASGTGGAAASSGGGAAAGGGSGGGSGHGPMPHPQPGPPGSAQIKPVRGRAVHPVQQAGAASAGGGFPTVLVISLVVVIVALVVGGIIIVPRLTRTPTPYGTTSPVAISAPPTQVVTSAPPSVLASVPPPVAFADHTADGFDPSAVLDQNTTTFWSSPVQRTPKADDAWIGLDMGAVAPRSSLTVVPRDGRQGFPTMFQIQSSVDGQTWETIPGQTYNSDNPDTQSAQDGPQVFMFAQPVSARFIRIFAVVLSREGAFADTAVNAGYALQIAEMSVSD